MSRSGSVYRKIEDEQKNLQTDLRDVGVALSMLRDAKPRDVVEVAAKLKSEVEHLVTTANNLELAVREYAIQRLGEQAYDVA